MNDHSREHDVDEHGDEFWHRHRHGGKRFKMRFPGPPEPPEGPVFRGHRGYVAPEEFGPPFPLGPHGGPPFGPWARGYGRRGSRAKRGDVRAAALALLAEEPLNGYQIIQQISERSGGLWRPSPGSVYPALAQLEDEDLITSQANAGERRAYTLTDAGRAYVTEHADELRAPWAAVSGDAASAAADMRSLVRQVHVAAFQVLSAGTEAQQSQARKVLAQARRSLYRILAEDESAEQEGVAVEPDSDRD
jgi:DNA-binding PadR family transcriptional regulator